MGGYLEWVKAHIKNRSKHKQWQDTSQNFYGQNELQLQDQNGTKLNNTMQGCIPYDWLNIKKSGHIFNWSLLTEKKKKCTGSRFQCH